MLTPETCAVHSGRAGVHSGQPRPRRPPAWQAVFSREGVVERRRRRRAVAQRRRPNAVIRILSPAPLYKVIPYGQSSGMERGVLGAAATYQFSWLGGIFGAGEFPP